MRYISFFFVILLTSISCKTSETKNRVNNTEDYSQAEIIVSDFSKKIPGYLQDMKIPYNFNEKDALKLLKENYPDQTKVSFIIENFKVQIKALNVKSYSLILCSLDGQNKLLEDLSCSLSKVDYRYWDKEKKFQPECGFETNWQNICQ